MPVENSEGMYVVVPQPDNELTPLDVTDDDDMNNDILDNGYEDNDIPPYYTNYNSTTPNPHSCQYSYPQ